MENHGKDHPKSNVNTQNQDEASKGLNDWNDRLDENLEPKSHNDEVADENAKDFSEQFGSGDQSDQD
ncbi:hypothetical protein [Pedobacter sp. BMA]|uniref:hypothetical protein n=1 Tax=Pedobacter sp. BMA TaxID=1663685 RepID=UPI000649EF09|nr:hypothetical protein [Pedobacter sp. BMA]KLT67302.1 hypothetical protein AB669_00860 [Pedobacter sp. BMA]